MMSRKALVGIAAVSLVPAAAGAQTQSRVSADVTASAGYSNNPFEIQGSDTGSAVVSLDIAPRYQLLTARSTFTVAADANIQQYLRRYGNNNGYSGSLDYQGRPNQRLTTHARLDLSSIVLGGYNNYYPVATGIGSTGVAVVDTSTAATTTTGSSAATATAIPVTSIAAISPITDVGLFGLRNRRKLGRASGDVALTLSAQDSLTASAYAELSRYGGGLAAGDYEAYGGTANYSRRLSSRWSIGVLGSGSTFHYHRIGDSQTYSIQATASGQVNERWTATGALGVSFVDGSNGASTRSTSLSGNASLCRSGPRTSMCVSAARQVSPTGFAGTQYVTSAGLSWSKRIDERQDVSLNAGYSKVGSGSFSLVAAQSPYQSQFVQAGASYRRRIAERLSLSAQVSYRDLLDGNVSRPTDIGGLIGLSYRLGDRR